MLPIGVDNFEKLIKNNYYYVDKTPMIADLLRDRGEVNLFTRPRRFGKSLNMSMLESFFSLNTDKSVFEGLKISEEKNLCAEHMGKYPVISISLREAYADSYDLAFREVAGEIVNCARKFYYLKESDRLIPEDREAYCALLKEEMDVSTLFKSLLTLSQLLEKHHGQKVIILIDEYDVPLAKADEYGYYDQMALLVRKLMSYCLKSNSSLQFAVLTGCMRVSKESIFTGLNNLRVLSISDVRFDEYFGFTDADVREMLAYYTLSGRYETVREWYDGYRFGNVNVYCPWDVINYCDRLLSDPDAEPENFWINSSGNDVVRRFIQCGKNAAVKNEIEKLVNGEAIEKTISQELTYPELYDSVENIWSVLFTTGYLTQKGRIGGNRFQLVIPNQEVRQIYITQILQFFKENVRGDGQTLNRFCSALEKGDAPEVERCFDTYLKRSISIRDTASPRPVKENFYHGILIGILGIREDWVISSNRESGEGYSDIIVEAEDSELAVIIEIKYAEDGDLDAACRKALRQIADRHYGEDLEEEYKKILKYGIACYKKRCRVMADDQNS